MNIFDTTGAMVMGAYLVLLVCIGVLGRRARRDDSLGDFYLGGRSFGTLVLFLTLYATQYSGLTLVGFAGRAYRSGFTFLVSVTFGCAIIGGYLLFAPELRRRAEREGYITVGDFIQARYQSRRLTMLGTGVFTFALSAYVLSNLKAVGYVVEAASGGTVSFAAGVLSLSVLMVAYETLGGLRAVAWTDTLQGAILLLGCAGAFAAVVGHYGLGASMAVLAQARPEFFELPGHAARAGWLSTVLLVMFGVSLYPHAIQRIYAARDVGVLRRSLRLMLLMPFLTTLPMILVGFIGAAHFPGLGRADSEQIVFHVLGALAQHEPLVRPLVVLLVCALLAAIMSTVDSALLAIASIFTRDFYAHLRPDRSEAQLTRAGKRFSWLLMAALAWLSIVLPQTLWRLTEIKLEVLVQMAPAVMLGLHLPRLRSRAVLRGLLLGLTLTLGIHLAAAYLDTVTAKPLGIHAGIWGLLANLGAVLSHNRWVRGGPVDPAASTGTTSA